MPHFQTIRLIREFFTIQGFLETPTPPMVDSPGMEAHITPFKVQGKNKSQTKYLHTSPEFYMKELLSQGFEKIYSLTYCFRDEPDSSTHRSQFLMLEWYRANVHYSTIKQDTLSLIEFVREGLEKENIKVRETLKVTSKTVNELFLEHLGISILEYLNPLDLKNLIANNFSELTGPDFLTSKWPWEDYFFLLFLNKIEPNFKQYDLLVVDEFPAPLAALATIKQSDSDVCERFEIYLRGVELCNCFNELTDFTEQERRFNSERKKRNDIYQDLMPNPEVLFNALKKGIPPSAGIALGVERLLLGLSLDEKMDAFFD